MRKNKRISQSITVFHDYPLPETKAELVGYIALITNYDLGVPIPDFLCAIGEKYKKYEQYRNWTRPWWRGDYHRHHSDN